MKITLTFLATILISHNCRADWTSLATNSELELIGGNKQKSDNPFNRNIRESSPLSQSVCSNPGLSASQKTFCLQFPGEIKYLSLGARLGTQECRLQLRDKTWNCPVKATNEGVSFKAKRNTREAGFGTAILAAAGMKMLASACNRGELANCKCTRDQTSCTGIQYGYDFSKSFIDVQEYEKSSGTGMTNFNDGNQSPRSKRKDDGTTTGKARRNQRRKAEQKLLNLYNNEVGRTVARQSARVSCKCHGVSGSCTTKTCAKKIDKFNQVGERLVKTYERAKRVRLNIRTGALVDRRNRNVVYVNRDGTIPSSQIPEKQSSLKLLFTRKPQDWCAVGNKGEYFNAGRKCRVDLPDNAEGSCHNLCCGYGYKRNRRTITTKCRCKFSWDNPDQLSCEQCEEIVEEYVCRSALGERRSRL